MHDAIAAATERSLAASQNAEDTIVLDNITCAMSHILVNQNQTFSASKRELPIPRSNELLPTKDANLSNRLSRKICSATLVLSYQ